MDSKLRIVHWNARGLKRKVQSFRLLLQEQNVDIALISETFLGPGDRLKIPGFLIYRKDETSETGRTIRGLAVLVRRNTIHQPLPLPNLQSIDTLGVELQLGNKHLQLYAAYRPPTRSLILSDIHALLDTPHPILIMGDLNAKHPAWNSRLLNNNGVRLFRDADKRGYTVSGPETPTHYPDNPTYMADVIDIAIYNNIPCQVTQQTLEDDFQSDHLPVLAVLDQVPTRMTPRQTHPAPNWREFKAMMEITTQTAPTNTPQDVNHLQALITTTIQNALKSTTPKKPSITKDNRLPSLPRDIRMMLQRKRKLRKRWQTNRCPTLKMQLNLLSAELHEEIRALSAERWTQHIESSSED